MGLNGLSSNFLILTKEQAFRGTEGNNLLVHAHYHTLAHSLFFLSYSFFLSKFPVFPLISHSFSYFFFSYFISPVFLSFLHPLLFFYPYYTQLKPFFYTAYCDRFLLFYPLTILSWYRFTSQTTYWSVGCPSITTNLC